MRVSITHSLIFPVLLLALPARADRDKPDTAWVLVEADNNHMSGSVEDLEVAKAQQRGDEPLLYVRRGGQAWVLRDAGSLARVRAAWAPADAVGEKMEPLGKKMNLLGKYMNQVGSKMNPIGQRMGELGALMAGGDDQDRAAAREEMDRLQVKMDGLNKKMQALNEEMQPLSREMERLGKEMQKVAKKCEAATLAVLDDAIARGIAEPVR